MKIAITGAAGLIGSTLGVRLINRGHSVRGIDNLVGGLPENAKIFGSQFYRIDCNDTELLGEILEGVDTLVDCAAVAYEGLSVFSPSYVSRNVFQSSVSSITAALASKVRRIVYFSSMARYGAGRAPFKESDTLAPIDPYGIAKTSVEQMLDCLKRYHDFEYTIIVPHNVYGPRQRYYDPFRNVISLTINRILLGMRPIVFGTGRQKRSFTYVDDIILPITQVIEGGGCDRKIFNVGSPPTEAVSILDLYEQICRTVGYKGTYAYENARANEVDEATCDVSLVERELGFSSAVSLEAGIAKCARFIEDNGPRSFEYGTPVEIHNDKVPSVWRIHSGPTAIQVIDRDKIPETSLDHR